MAGLPHPLVNTTSGTSQPLQSLEEQLSSLRATVDARKPRKTPSAARVHTNIKAGKENSIPTQISANGKAGISDFGAQESIRWSDPKNFHLTDSLLSWIEENVSYRRIFGFKPIEMQSTTNRTSLTIIQACREIVPMVFLETSMSVEKLEKLALAFKACMKKPSTKYKEYYNQLGSTGHGLIEEGRKAEIHEGTEIFNAWQKIQREFPWYL
ncbi:hypothetical protein BDQ17DRAFT_229841 [Cyathus striatus]|nr:hypothetical protein BDQ17DRAFT_229841 [Cyathus striatus]